MPVVIAPNAAPQPLLRSGSAPDLELVPFTTTLTTGQSTLPVSANGCSKLTLSIVAAIASGANIERRPSSDAGSNWEAVGTLTLAGAGSDSVAISDPTGQYRVTGTSGTFTVYAQGSLN